ncbi:hypothetical protein V495_00698 [Pseudogymnoascus sp. VKM F-4514 (FW-929)]|nr:hypothetical protein V495_00698 [Pseudogymnoascus sp. VKM F-4514 (FW-929)]KFY65770.1 hypothetical protein V497_01274 [Pseudogymnoascus sp. VKM F-4516 (FW-969)]
MKSLSFLVIWVLFLVNEVLALNTAVPYQLLYFYYGYKIEFSSLPAAERKIAVKCIHRAKPGTAEGAAVEAAIAAQGLPGICTFGEFALHVLGKQSGKLYTGTGITIDPDSSAAKDFPTNEENGLRMSTKILSDNKPRALKDVIDVVTKQIQMSRSRAAASPDVSSKVTALLTKATGYVRIIVHWRLQDMASLKGVEFRKANPDWVKFIVMNKVDTFDLDGKKVLSSYEDIDIGKTINAGTTLPAEEKDKLEAWSKKYTELNTVQNHQTLIDTLNDTTTKLNGTPECT